MFTKKLAKSRDIFALNGKEFITDNVYDLSNNIKYTIRKRNHFLCRKQLKIDCTNFRLGVGWVLSEQKSLQNE